MSNWVLYKQIGRFYRLFIGLKVPQKYIKSIFATFKHYSKTQNQFFGFILDRKPANLNPNPKYESGNTDLPSFKILGLGVLAVKKYFYIEYWLTVLK